MQNRHHVGERQSHQKFEKAVTSTQIRLLWASYPCSQHGPSIFPQATEAASYVGLHGPSLAIDNDLLVKAPNLIRHDYR